MAKIICDHHTESQRIFHNNRLGTGVIYEGAEVFRGTGQDDEAALEGLVAAII